MKLCIFHCQILKKILKTNNIKTEHIDIKKITKQGFKGDKIEFGVDFLGKTFDISLKRKYFFILKGIVEKYWDVNDNFRMFDVGSLDLNNNFLVHGRTFHA